MSQTKRRKTHETTACTAPGLLYVVCPRCLRRAAGRSPADDQSQTDDTPDDTPDDGGSTPVDNVVRMGRDMASTGNLDSLLTTYNNIFEVSDCVFDQLIRKNPYTLELEPNLITDFPEISEDGTLFTFELKQGVKFHDGTELTSKDVQYTFSRFFDPDYGNLNGWMANMIKGSQAMMDSESNGPDRPAGFRRYHRRLSFHHRAGIWLHRLLAVLAVARSTSSPWTRVMPPATAGASTP